MKLAGFRAYRDGRGGVRFEAPARKKGEPLEMDGGLAAAIREVADVVLAVQAGDLAGVPEELRCGCRCPACGDGVTFEAFWSGIPSAVCGRTTDVKACPFREGWELPPAGQGGAGAGHG